MHCSIKLNIKGELKAQNTYFLASRLDNISCCHCSIDSLLCSYKESVHSDSLRRTPRLSYPIRRMSKRLLSGADGRFDPSSSASKGNNADILDTLECNIICGRGLHVSCHRGNLNLHRIVNQYRETYLASHRSHKSMIVRHIINEIKNTGAKFIRRADDDSTDDKWVEVDDKTAYTKVSHALRLRKPVSGQGNAQSVSHSVATPSSMPQHEMSHLSRLSALSSQSQLMPLMSVGQPQSIATLSHPQPQAPHILGGGCGELLLDHLYLKVYARTLAILTQPIHQQASGQDQISSDRET